MSAVEIKRGKKPTTQWMWLPKPDLRLTRGKVEAGEHPLWIHVGPLRRRRAKQ